MEITTGQIVDWQMDGTVLIRAPLPDIDRAILRKYKTVSIGFDDGRRISHDQRKKAFALLGELAEWAMGFRNESTVQTMKEQMKLEFITKRQQALAVKMFSLSDTDVTTAREFISYLIDFMLEWEVPSSRPLVEYSDDIARYIYSCLIHKKCAVCGRESVLHHCEGSRIGMGNNRKEVNHLGRDALPLCTLHHTELHSMPESEFMAKYHLEPVKIDEKIAKIYKLNTKEES